MAGLIFGTAGIPLSSRKRTSIDGIKRLVELGLGLMEVEFVQKVTMKEETAREVGDFARKEGIVLTVHAPYYINFNSHEEDKVKASRERLLLAARRGYHLGARGVVFHPAFRHDDPLDEVARNVKRNVEIVREELDAEGTDIVLRMETTGSVSQFGDLEETLLVTREIPGVAPCIDFSHLHAREGKYNSYDEFVSILEKVKEVYGPEGLKDMHIHVSGIDYGDRGEKKHLVLRESDLKYEELLQALKDMGAEGVVVCESPNIEEDALLLAKTYAALS